MKRIFAILLLCVHLFYIGGYAILFQYYINKADKDISELVFANKIENNKFLQIKIPVNNPTTSDQSEYAYVSGQIELKGNYYNYVRLKITRDTLFFVCLPNATKTRLVNATIITTKQINDMPVNKGSHNPGVKKVNFLSEYNFNLFEYSYTNMAIFINNYHQYSVIKLSNPFIASPGKPPTVVA